MIENEIDERPLHEIFFDIPVKQEEEKPEEVVQEEKPVEVKSEEKPAEDVQEEKPVITVEKKKVWTPEYQEQVAELFNKKYGHKGLTDEQKALAYLKQQNPELDDNELNFLAATDYGIGSAEQNEDELTDEQVAALRRQGIDRKKLFSNANKYFDEQSNGIELPEPDIEDAEYTQWKVNQVTQQQEQAKQQELLKQTIQNFETNIKAISELSEVVEINIDDRKLPVDINFKLDEAKQKRLLEYIEGYHPSKEEVAQFTDTQSGKFDYKGYAISQAPKVFYKEMLESGIKQALTQDRQQFVEKELKNSTLRNNDVSSTVERKFDMVESWPFGR